MAEVLLTTISYGDVVVKIYAEQVGDDVVLRIDSNDSTTTFDLTGLFIDYGNDGGSVTSVGSKANNMNGADSADGTKFDGFDAGFELGTIGGKDADYMNGTITLAGIDLSALDGAQIGLRMQGVDSLDGGSLKLSGIAEVPDDTPDDTPDDFPEFSKDISHVTFYFDQDAGDVKPSPDGDGFYTVKINTTSEVDDDLDTWIQDALTYLIANDPNVSSDDTLLGVAIKGGKDFIEPGVDEAFYAYGDNNDNGDLPDTPPIDPLVENKAVDQVYNYDGELFSIPLV